MGTNRSSFGFLWNERGFCICGFHVSERADEARPCVGLAAEDLFLLFLCW